MKLDDIKKLHQKKYREDFGHYIVEGEHLILELEKAADRHLALAASRLIVTEKYANWPSPFEKTIVSEKNFAQLSDTKTPQGIAAVVPCVFAKKAPQAASPLAMQDERAIYLHEVQDPGNLGTILRSLAWFGEFRLLLSKGSVDPFNAKVVRSSMGAIFHVPVELNVELETLPSRFSNIGYLTMTGAPLTHPSFNECDCFIFGNEARGVPSEALASINANAFTIRGSGAIESLNLATAVNLCVYELSR
ncbi:MAG: TrmH family RNA methyltransferase [Cellvibrio sp.]